MKPQIFSIRNALISIAGFLLLVTTMQTGCGVLFNVNRVVKLHPVILTQEDLPKMRLTSSHRGSRPLSGVPSKDSPIILKFEQQWNGNQLTVGYWLFDSSYTAKKAAGEYTFRMVAGVPNYQPESNLQDVIGDATWRMIPKRWWEKDATDLWFVKNNVVVYVSADGQSPDQLQFARDVARKIEAKVTAVLKKK